MLRPLIHLCLVALLTVLTQVGGAAWCVALAFRNRMAVFVLAYATFSIAALFAAPLFGRQALSCWTQNALQVQSPLYCVLNRTYVTPELAQVLHAAAREMQRQFPGTVTVVLDAGFPFFDGFPLLPHLSHDDGQKVDVGFFYRSAEGYLPGQTRSPLGYFAFENGPSDCPDSWPTLRWDLAPLQPLWRNLTLDIYRTRALVSAFVDDGRVGKVFLEPHLQRRLGLSADKLRFQGCRAARHDDHIHIQL